MINQEKIDIIDMFQRFFIKSFWISFILLIVASLLCMVFNPWQVMIAERFFNVDAEDLGKITLFIFGLWKVLIIQFTLVPIFASCCLKKCCSKKLEKQDS